MVEIVYSVRVGKASYGDINIWDVKIGKTTNLNSTMAQYSRSHSHLKLLDLWKPNKDLTLENCEKGVHEIAKKYAYTYDGEKFIFLMDSYQNFANNVNLVLEKTTREIAEGKEEEKISKPQDRIFTGRKPKFIKFKGTTKEVKTWRQILETVSKEIFETSKDFARVTEIKGREREYFTKNPSILIHPKKIPGSPYYFEANISANSTMRIITKMLKLFGYKQSDLQIGYER